MREVLTAGQSMGCVGGDLIIEGVRFDVGGGQQVYLYGSLGQSRLVVDVVPYG